ncbi:hypothetical protein I3843_15G061400 [Carya illinoinensis]|uniref:Dof zinc finger protein n=1 Tax=Carya illinoinensis TaxID=32201 RepID=A0A8T1N4U3_CARIL|nr:dof zinc finger protein DOF1.6-like [Carya illinoinensis]KAG2666490.1 hypothetical protein I3760_15G063600 [Carya illinoinensis]KAG6626659.1 hypothetical protein CIPAW_15G066200 [Carya illinoinensis]KAG6674808.1 hypothetical protein I3842_15G064200 [Carya illinoinensis]KAG7943785.1 hypothetical protein I3843_15G061400 [Carya illinoinensis]
MPSDTAEHKPVRVQQSFPHPPPPQTQPLPCPRCGSTSTKFCYYNNYNLSQPRHFCKSCRRYWTQGGTLRNVPVGGGTRKSITKRSRSTTSTSSSSSSSSSTVTSEAVPANPISGLPEMVSHDVSLNDNVAVGGGYVGSFNFLLNSQGPGFMGPGGYGLGSMPGFDEMGFGLAGGGSWAFPEVGDFGGGSGNGASVASAVYNTWQMTGMDAGGLNDGGDSFASPDLAISTPGQFLEK